MSEVPVIKTFFKVNCICILCKFILCGPLLTSIEITQRVFDNSIIKNVIAWLKSIKKENLNFVAVVSNVMMCWL
ncbi:hypothetical protein CWB73_08020 [Pseudoalteromonas phenolica]|uniref:Uncharacterized protein n=1 Tax=Pseudoalteromonas phenolica TaxID=161398 RepID=A0A5S3YW44_9GAMM|nr:hypothetical protein CWB72_02640 [Pseudoalteromonas phenolica]TMP81510.1 hypothetical protein CWB73_08020 [Pseudoalteromonas phenolica]